MLTRILGFDGKKLGKIYSRKNNIFLMQQLQFRTSKLQETPSALKREHPALQNLKFLLFFLFFNVTFALLDPYPADTINADPCESRSETLL
jgi:hypothetical protein